MHHLYFTHTGPTLGGSFSQGHLASKQWSEDQNPTAFHQVQLGPQESKEGPGSPTEPLLKPTLCTRTSRRLLKPFRLRLFMSLFSSVWLSTCNSQEKTVSSGPPESAVPPAALPPGDRRTETTLTMTKAAQSSEWVQWVEPHATCQKGRESHPHVPCEVAGISPP